MCLLTWLSPVSGCEQPNKFQKMRDPGDLGFYKVDSYEEGPFWSSSSVWGEEHLKKKKQAAECVSSLPRNRGVSCHVAENCCTLNDSYVGVLCSLCSWVVLSIQTFRWLVPKQLLWAGGSLQQWKNFFVSLCRILPILFPFHLLEEQETKTIAVSWFVFFKRSRNFFGEHFIGTAVW